MNLAITFTTHQTEGFCPWKASKKQIGIAKPSNVTKLSLESVAQWYFVLFTCCQIRKRILYMLFSWKLHFFFLSRAIVVVESFQFYLIRFWMMMYLQKIQFWFFWIKWSRICCGLLISWRKKSLKTKEYLQNSLIFVLLLS